MPLKIEGNKINLRSLKRSDAYSIYKYAKDKAIGRYTLLPQPYRLKHAKGFIERTHKNLREKTYFEFGIELKETGEIIGMMSLLHVDFPGKKAEVGYWLAKKYWGQGIAGEALNLALNFAYKNLKLNRIYAMVMSPNTGSIKLLEKCFGFELEGRLKNHCFRNNRFMDDLRFALFKQEYAKHQNAKHQKNIRRNKKSCQN